MGQKVLIFLSVINMSTEPVGQPNFTTIILIALLGRRNLLKSDFLTSYFSVELHLLQTECLIKGQQFYCKNG